MSNEFYPLIFQKAATLLANVQKGKITAEQAYKDLTRFCIDLCVDAVQFLYSMMYTQWEDIRERKRRGKQLYKQIMSLIRDAYVDYERQMLHVKRKDLEHMLPDLQEKLDDELRKRGAL